MKKILTAKLMLQIVSVLSSEEIEISMDEVMINLQRMKGQNETWKGCEGTISECRNSGEKTEKPEAWSDSRHHRVSQGFCFIKLLPLTL